MTKARTVWLVGMMGAGKSTVGRALARRLDRPFLDSDEEIEREAGCEISEIFAREGEAGFRARERRAVQACAGSGAVVALGGGAFAQPELGDEVARSGPVVYLRAAPQTLLARVGEAGERPLLAGLDREGRLARLGELLAQREPAYARAALSVEVDEAGVEQVVERIAGRLEEQGA